MFCGDPDFASFFQNLLSNFMDASINGFYSRRTFWSIYKLLFKLTP
jgi:hypothetical protein